MASEVWDDPNKQVQMLSFSISHVFMVEWKPAVFYCKKPGVGITLWGAHSSEFVFSSNDSQGSPPGPNSHEGPGAQAGADELQR